MQRLGKVVYTRAPLSTSSIICYLLRGNDSMWQRWSTHNWAVCSSQQAQGHANGDEHRP